MRSFFSTVPVADPGTTLGGGGILPPREGGRRGWDDGDDYNSLNFDARLRRARLGLLVGLTGILMVFISFTSAYIVRQGLPTLDPRTNSLVHDWLPVRLPGILLVNTLVLVISSVTVELARRKVLGNVSVSPATVPLGISQGGLSEAVWLALTVVFGLTFLTGQWLAWRQLTASGLDVASSPSSSFVYVLTGMHGLHLLGGLFALLTAGAAAMLRRPAESRAVILDVTAWYWHSMAALWIYILCLLKVAG